MGNKLSACGCGQEQTSRIETPYCRKISDNLVRFWAEIFLLAQEEKSRATKWQMLTQKLLPVNLAVLQNSPAVVSHITAYSSKVDKVMDTVTYCPGIDLFRGSDCFVYWCDPQKGLTWGLNFISADDAAYFVDVVTGKSNQECLSSSQRAGSSQNLSDQRNGKHRASTSTPATPEVLHQSRRPTVTFVEVATTFNANSLPTTPRTLCSSSEHIQQFRQDLLTAAADWYPPCQASERRPTEAATFELYDNLDTFNLLLPADLANRCAEKEIVWQRQSSAVNNSSAAGESSLMHMSLDSTVLKRMIDPLPMSAVSNYHRASSTDRLPDSTRSPLVVPSGRNRRTSFTQGYPNPNGSECYQSNLNGFECYQPKHGCLNRFAVSSSSSTTNTSTNSVDTATAGSDYSDVTLKQNNRRVKVIPTKIANENGLVNGDEPGTRLRVKELTDDSNSMNSSFDGSTSSQSNNANEFNSINKPSSPNNKIRKAGHVVLKKWLTPNSDGVAVVSVEAWKRFWCCLKGFSIYFYNILPTNSSSTSPSADNSPQATSGVGELCLSNEPEISIDLLNCLAQAVPEYPRREHVFCLTTGTGSSYLIQVATDVDVDGWIQVIHTAGAMALARTTSRDVAQRAVRKELEKLEQKLDSVLKMMKISQLPSTIATAAVTNYQLEEWDDEVELLNVHQFMGKCYWAALKSHESPSCKKMMTAATKSTKAHLSRLGAFTGSSMHASVMVKSSGKLRSSYSTSPIRRTVQIQADCQQQQLDERQYNAASPGKLFKSRASLVQIALPNQQVTVVSVGDMETVTTVLQKACEKANLKYEKCFMLLRRITSPNESQIPCDNEALQPKIATHQVEIRERLVYHAHLNRIDSAQRIYGLTIRAQKHSSSKTRMTITVTNVDENGLAKRAGLIVGDELLAINNQHVSNLHSSEIEIILQDSQTLCLALRTKRVALPLWLEPMYYTGSDESIKMPCTIENGARQLGVVHRNSAAFNDEEEEYANWFSDTCNQQSNRIRYRHTNYRNTSLGSRGRQRLSLPVIPTHPGLLTPPHRDSTSAQTSPNHVDALQRSCHTSGTPNLLKRISSSEPGSIMTSSVNHGSAVRSSSVKMATTERLEKIIYELVETEKAYVKDLEILLNVYLQPICNERLLPTEDLEKLITSTFAIVKFQKAFLEELTEAVLADSAQETLTFASPNHLRNALLHLGGVFLTSASGFKVYSSFCAAYFRFQKKLQLEDQNEALQRFLLTCNVNRQHSATLESHLIKPVQRVLRYPLFLQQIKTLTGPHQPEHVQVGDALVKMEKVAEYINEMQRIYEEYGPLFNQVQAQNRLHSSEMSFELCDLLMFGEVEWLNSVDDQGKKKSAAPVECLCFVFKSAILLMSQEKQRQRKNKITNGDKQQPMYRFIPINELEINGSDVGSSDNRFIWILIHIDPHIRAEKVYHFANKKPEAKQQFLKAIRRAGVLNAKQNGCHQKNNNSLKTISSSPGLPVKRTTGLVSGNGHQSTSVIKRPASYHSNQSDPGYGSSTNGAESQKRIM